MADEDNPFDNRADSNARLVNDGDTSPLPNEGRTPTSLLVVDDNEMNRDMLSRRLTRRGYNVTVATGGMEAIDCLTDSSFDAILLDIMMPVMNGWEVLKRIREQYSREQLPVIMATAKESSEDVVHALEVGANDYVTKPFDFQVVLARVDTHVSLKRTSESLVAMNQQLQELARHDALTGALNRHSFTEIFEIHWKQSKRYRKPLSCVMLDTDFFKRVNDTFGHAAGDRVLQRVADILRLNSRETDFVGRFGGEEFCILLPETDEQGAHAWCERVRQDVAELSIPEGGQNVRITASLGVTTCSKDYQEPQELFEQADQAMFTAKRLGRNRVVAFHRQSPLDGNDRSQVLSNVTADELMIPLSTSVSPEQTVREVVGLLQSAQADSATVCNADGTLVGIIDEGDIMTAMLASDVLASPVAELMKTQLVRYSAKTTAREIFEFLCRGTDRQVFIVDGPQPLGVIRRTDLIRWITEAKIDPSPTVDISPTAPIQASCPSPPPDSLSSMS